MQRVGRWSYELATGRLHRSDTLEELYRSIGVDPDAADSRAPEREQVALLCQGLRFGDGPRQHHVQVPLPGAGLLSCRAEVECAAGRHPAADRRPGPRPEPGAGGRSAGSGSPASASPT